MKNPSDQSTSWLGAVRACRSLVSGSVLLALLGAQPVFANNIGENVAWQFETPADKANRAFIEDMRLKRQSGYYAAPVYTTNIDKQYNCSVSSLATGNQSSSTAIGNSPTTSGNSSSSVGNANTNDVAAATAVTGVDVTGFQENHGEVESTSAGAVSAAVRGDAFQTLNNDQQNTGAQSATINGSTACQYGPLN